MSFLYGSLASWFESFLKRFSSLLSFGVPVAYTEAHMVTNLIWKATDQLLEWNLNKLWRKCKLSSGKLFIVLSAVSVYKSHIILVASGPLKDFQKSFNNFFLLNFMPFSNLLDTKKQSNGLHRLPILVVKSFFLVLVMHFCWMYLNIGNILEFAIGCLYSEWISYEVKN